MRETDIKRRFGKKLSILVFRASVLILLLFTLHCPKKEADITPLLLFFLLQSSSSSSGSSSTPWVEQTSPTSNSLTGAAYLNNEFWAVGQTGTLLRSSDGESWTQVTLVTANHVNDIALVGTTYVIVGDNRFVAKSANGTAWTETAVAGGAGSEQFKTIVTDGTITAFLGHPAAGGATVLCTTNDLNMYSCNNNMGSNTTVSAVYAQSKNVGVGKAGHKVECSSSCFTTGNWSASSISGQSSNNYTGLVYADSKFVMVGYNNSGSPPAVLTSSDFSSFEEQTSEATSGQLWDIEHDGTQYVSIGTTYSVPTSINGTTWSNRRHSELSSVRTRIR